jgi:hypothetical protein
VAHSDLNGHGDGGEGLAIQLWPDGLGVQSRPGRSDAAFVRQPGESASPS